MKRLFIVIVLTLGVAACSESQSELAQIDEATEAIAHQPERQSIHEWMGMTDRQAADSVLKLLALAPNQTLSLDKSEGDGKWVVSHGDYGDQALVIGEYLDGGRTTIFTVDVEGDGKADWVDGQTVDGVLVKKINPVDRPEWRAELDSVYAFNLRGFIISRGAWK